MSNPESQVKLVTAKPNMAQLEALEEADDEFPPVSVLLGQREGKQSRPRTGSTSNRKAQGRHVTTSAPRRQVSTESSRASYMATSASNGRKEICQEKPFTSRKQRPLGSTNIGSLLLPLSTLKLDEKEEDPKRGDTTSDDGPPIRRTPRRKAKGRVRYEITESDIFEDPLEDVSSVASDESFDDLSDFIVHDSASEEELRRPPPSLRKKKKEKALNGNNKHQRVLIPDHSGGNVPYNSNTGLSFSPAKGNIDLSKNALNKDTKTDPPKELFHDSFKEPLSSLRL